VSDKTSIAIIILMLLTILGCATKTNTAFDHLICVGFCEYAEASQQNETKPKEEKSNE